MHKASIHLFQIQNYGTHDLLSETIIVYISKCVFPSSIYNLSSSYNQHAGDFWNFLNFSFTFSPSIYMSVELYLNTKVHIHTGAYKMMNTTYRMSKLEMRYISPMGKKSKISLFDE